MREKGNDTTQLCSVGDELYRISSKYGHRDELYIEHIIITLAKFTGDPIFGHWYYRDNKNRTYFNRNIKKSCYKTKDEAEEELLKRKNIMKKHDLLKEYEKKLNKELNIDDHYIIK